MQKQSIHRVARDHKFVLGADVVRLRFEESTAATATFLGSTGGYIRTPHPSVAIEQQQQSAPAVA